MTKKLILSGLIALFALVSSGPSVSHADTVEFFLTNNAVGNVDDDFDFNDSMGTFDDLRGYLHYSKHPAATSMHQVSALVSTLQLGLMCLPT